MYSHTLIIYAYSQNENNPCRFLFCTFALTSPSKCIHNSITNQHKHTYIFMCVCKLTARRTNKICAHYISKFVKSITCCALWCFDFLSSSCGWLLLSLSSSYLSAVCCRCVFFSAKVHAKFIICLYKALAAATKNIHFCYFFFLCFGAFLLILFIYFLLAFCLFCLNSFCCVHCI